jgi:large subunit ribosomal protein L22
MTKIVFAKNKYVDKTARKVRLLVDLIRGKKLPEAMALLQFSNKSASENVIKTLKSAAANATNNFGMNKNDLVVVKAFVDEAPTFKRGRAVSRGRYHQILKRNSHITIGVSDLVETEEKAKAVKSVKAKEVKKEVKPEKKAVKKINKVKKVTNGK